MNELLAPSTICFLAAFLLIVLGIGESWFGARRQNVSRQRGGYGIISLGMVFLISAILQTILGVR